MDEKRQQNDCFTGCRHRRRRDFRATVERAATLKMADAFNPLNCGVFTPIANRLHGPEGQQRHLVSGANELCGVV